MKVSGIKRLLPTALAVIFLFSLLPALTVGVKADVLSDALNKVQTELAAMFDWSTIPESAYVHVSNDTELRAAITAAPNNVETIIVLDCDITVTSIYIDIPSDKIILLTSTGGAVDDTRKTLRQNKETTLWVVSVNGTLYLENITITDGNCTNDGGGLYVSGKLYICDETLITENKARYGGGGAYCTRGTVIMTGGEISGNSSGNTGGGVNLYTTTYGSSYFIMTGGLITGNNAGPNYGGGGGVYSTGNDGNIIITGGKISNNTASMYGGGVRVGTNFVMTGGEISGNTVTDGNGGGVYANFTQGMAIGDGAKIINNSAPLGDGGGVYLGTSYLGYLTVQPGAVFYGNTASKVYPNYTIASPYDTNIGVADYAWSKYYKDGGYHDIQYGYNNYDINYTSGPSITPDELPKNILYIHKFALDDPGNKSGPAGTGSKSDGDTVPEGATPLNGVPFSVYLINSLNEFGPNDEVSYSPGNPTITVNGVLYSLSGPKTGVTAKVDAGTVDEYDGTIKFDGLDNGVYLVVEGVCGGVQQPAKPFIVQLPMPDPEGGADLTVVHVYPKNELISVDKSANPSTVKSGETVTYTITIDKPDNYGELDVFTLTDNFVPALQFLDDSVKVELLMNNNSLGAAVAYPYTYSSGTLAVDLHGIAGDFDQIVVTFDVRVVTTDSSVWNTASVLGVDSNPCEVKVTKDDYQLPHTGGSGLVMFTVLGVAVMGGLAAIMTGGRRRRKAYPYTPHGGV